MTAYATDHLEPSPFDDRVAPTYDAGSAHMFRADVLGPTVDVLQELAGDGAALELASGTGRVALPLAERGVEVHGTDFSEAIVAQLRGKPGGDRLPVTIGDMATTRVGSGYRLAYLVHNTITNLLTQDEQVEPALRVAPQHAEGGGRGRSPHRHVCGIGPPLRVAVGARHLMARIAGLRLRERWADWDRSAFTAESASHVSVWTKAAE